MVLYVCWESLEWTATFKAVAKMLTLLNLAAVLVWIQVGENKRQRINWQEKQIQKFIKCTSFN